MRPIIAPPLLVILWMVPAVLADDLGKASFYEQDVGGTARLVVLCEKLPDGPLTPEQRAEIRKIDPDHPPRGPERYQYSFMLQDQGGKEKTRTLWVYTVYDWLAVFGRPANFSILAVSVETHALVVVYHLAGGTCANVIPLDGMRRGVGMPAAEGLVRESGSSDPTIDSARILGSYETGDLTVVLHNIQETLGPEFYKFSLQPQWVREPEAPSPTTQPATSQP